MKKLFLFTVISSVLFVYCGNSSNSKKDKQKEVHPEYCKMSELASQLYFLERKIIAYKALNKDTSFVYPLDRKHDRLLDSLIGLKKKYEIDSENEYFDQCISAMLIDIESDKNKLIYLSMLDDLLIKSVDIKRKIDTLPNDSIEYYRDYTFRYHKDDFNREFNEYKEAVKKLNNEVYKRMNSLSLDLTGSKFTSMSEGRKSMLVYLAYYLDSKLIPYNYYDEYYEEYGEINELDSLRGFTKIKFVTE